MRKLNEVHNRLRELKTEYADLQKYSEDTDTYYENEFEFNSLWNRIKELEWVLGIK